MRECCECKWITPITDSSGRELYLCIDVESGAYLGETGICGNCNLEPLDIDD